MQNNQTANEIIAAFDADRANASRNRNRRDRSAQQIGLLGSLLTGYARLGVAAALVAVVLSVVVGLS